VAGSHGDSAFLLERTHSIGSVAVACVCARAFSCMAPRRPCLNRLHDVARTHILDGSKNKGAR